jgi:hypothetical protein
MSSTPHDTGSTTPQPGSGPTVDEDVAEDAESGDLEEQLELVATKSPI